MFGVSISSRPLAVMFAFLTSNLPCICAFVTLYWLADWWHVWSAPSMAWLWHMQMSLLSPAGMNQRGQADVCLQAYDAYSSDCLQHGTWGRHGDRLQLTFSAAAYRLSQSFIRLARQLGDAMPLSRSPCKTYKRTYTDLPGDFACSCATTSRQGALCKNASFPRDASRTTKE